MRHLLLSGPLVVGGEHRLGGEEFHYLAHVLRLGPGDEIPAVGRGTGQGVLRVRAVTAREIVLQVERVESTAPRNELPPIILYQGIPKGRKLDDIVRMAVQAGATRIVPVRTSRSVVKLDGGLGPRLDRLKRVAREAVQQSGAKTSVEIDDAVPISDVAVRPGYLSLVLDPAALAYPSLHSYLSDVPDGLAVCVGPEGGFAPEEVDQLVARGFHRLCLGPQILRTEVAGLFAIAAMRILILEHDEWQVHTSPKA